MEKALFIHDDRSLQYRKTGNGPLLVLIHGFGMDGQIWDHLLPVLADRYCCVVPDVPGSGLSDLPGQWSIDSFAEAIAALVDLIGY